jgi:GntR family transcriptional regulator, rspAB operon transcriptional repressor
MLETKRLVPAAMADPEFLVDVAYDAIHAAIVRNELKPGTALSEGALSEQLGISRTPIREALKRLEEERLVRIVPRRGAFVTDVSAEDIMAIYQLREALECYAIQFVPVYGDPVALELLAAEVKQAPDWLARGEIDHVNDLDIRLHRFVAESSRNPLVVKLVEQLLHQVQRLRLMTPTIPGRLDRQMHEHQLIIGALVAGKVDEAREALRVHLQTVRDTAVQIRLRM